MFVRFSRKSEPKKGAEKKTKTKETTIHFEGNGIGLLTDPSRPFWYWSDAAWIYFFRFERVFLEILDYLHELCSEKHNEKIRSGFHPFLNYPGVEPW